MTGSSRTVVDGAGSLQDRPFSALLADAAVQASIERVGYAVVGPVLGATETAELTRVYERLRPVIDSRSEERWFTSGAMTSPENRRDLYESVGRVLRPVIAGLAAPGTDILAGNFHVNPAGSVEGLGPHQDIALVDELRCSTVNGWIPLTDVSVDDGPLHVVPGSHRFGNSDRSLAVPWAYEGLHELFWEYAVPLEVPAGHLVLFDTAMIHCSTANPGPMDRIAVNCLILPSDRELRHLVAAEDGSDRVDVFLISPDFLIEGDVWSRPGAGVATLLGTRPVRRPPTSAAEVRDQCRAGRALAGE